MATSKITSDSIQDNAVSDSKLASTLDLTGKSISMTDLNLDAGYGSTAPVYGVRAWVNFNGTGTVAIRASGNVSSITDNGTGDYTVNFTSAMPDTNYAISGSSGTSSSGSSYRILATGSGLNGDYSVTTSSVRVQAVYIDANIYDAELISVVISR